MMQLTPSMFQLPFFQTFFYVLTFSSMIWVLTAFLALKRILTRSTDVVIPSSTLRKKDFNIAKLTIVIPARNEEKYILRCVKSLLRQSYRNLEILVINDNSEDMTADILKSIPTGKLKVITVDSLPLGWARKAWACQVGFDNSTGDLLLFTDADTNYFDKDAILNCVTEMVMDSNKVTTGVPLLELRDFYSKMVMPLLNLFVDCFDGFSRTYESKIICSFFLVRREVLASIDGFNRVKNSFQEDSDIGIEIKKLGLKIRRKKLNNMVSAIWSRDYETLQQGITRIIAYDFQRKKIGFICSCFLLCTSIIVPYVLVLYSGIVYWINGNQMDYKFLVWNLILCLIPVLGYLVVNRIKHRSQSLYCLMVFAASCLILFSLSTILCRFISKPSKKEIVWKGVKYAVAN